MYDIERYLNIRSAFGASFGPEGTLAFRTDTTGTPQVWTLEEPGAWPEQRTFYDERVTFASWSPERRELAFGMDEGGDERQKLFRLDPDGTVRTLTPADAKHRWGGWSHDGDRFAFASNRRDESVFDVYVQGRDDEDAEMLLEGDGWLSLGGWSPSDDRLLVHEARSSFDHDVYVLDIETETTTHLTDHDASEVRYSSLSWGPDGEGVYCCTDLDADTLYLARLDAEDGAATTVEEGGGEREGARTSSGASASDGQWNLDGIALDDGTGRLVYSRNVGGYTDLTVGELAGPETVETYPDPDLPDGVADGVSFDDDAERFALTVTADTENTNVYVVDVETGAAERWTHAATAGIPPETFVESESVAYESFDGREIPGFLSVPREVPDGGAPVVVDIHGGPESQRRPSFSPVKQYLLAHGYAVFEPNVRGSTGYGRAYTHLDDVEKRTDAVADIRAAVEWLADHDAVDGDRVVAKGGSYGGFMVLAALTEYPELWAAGVDIVGIANFVTFLENTGSWRRELREAEYGSLEADRELLEDISPINDIEAIEAPLFVLHGANDPRVPVGEAEQIADRAAEQGVPVRKRIFEDEGHGITKLENRIEAYAGVVEFLDEHVRGESDN
ncbi:S9 family peptidase [Halobacteriales archaeon SW_5_68_122]|nr:MAG: S9 family peptidase [Halobacteriales archaeon SW_5_68_122]